MGMGSEQIPWTEMGPTLEQAIASAERMRNPARKLFAYQWINHRWHGALEPSVPDEIRSRDVAGIIAKLGGRRPIARLALPKGYF